MSRYGFDTRARGVCIEDARVMSDPVEGRQPMKPMFLPEVEHHAAPGPYRALIEQMQNQGSEYPQIWHLFAYLPKATEHLARFTQEVLRGPAPLSPGLRELIAAYTSRRNHCPF
jgi:alkylhydroperoxidase family enzyme